MAKISLAGFTDPVRRPRYIIWTGVAVVMFAAVMVTVLGVTSTRWFCSQGCHKVQDDTIVSYERSTHAELSCMSCHMPINANPIVFMLHKVAALGELAQTVSNTYELPLNKRDEVALTMSSVQCTQCHSVATRKISPSPGIKINHQIHIDRGVQCTICHNRIAHKEDFVLQLTDPKSKQPNQKHPDFSRMTACFRCHGLEPGSSASGTCVACHTPGFELKPPSHLAGDFFPKRHGELAKEALAEVAKALKETGDTTVTVERKSEWKTIGKNSQETLGQKLVPVGEVFYCGTCHQAKFCTDCHGLPMPHGAEFRKPKAVNDPLGHATISKQNPTACITCHTKDNPNFCLNCHHGIELNRPYDPSQPWLKVHPIVVKQVGALRCYGKPVGTTGCHDEAFCSDCHVNRAAALKKAGY